MSTLLLILLLVVLIVVHECGHFIAAKMLGVQVKEFGIGYPPRAFLLMARKGTEYTVNWLPFGGFVRLLEEDGSDTLRNVAGSFASAPRYKQVLILLAGVFSNLVFGWILFTGGFMSGMPVQVFEYSPDARLVVSNITPGSPAERAGFMPGDEIVGITDVKEAGIEELTPSKVVDFVQAHGGSALSITYVRAGIEEVASLIPAHAILKDAPSQPALGIGLVLIAEKQLGFFESAWEALKQTTGSLVAVAVGFATLVRDALFGNPDIRTLIGPVGLVSEVGDAASHGLGQFFGLAALVSINLVIINLIPIPALDGGRLFFIAIEAVRGKKLSRMFAQIMNTAGFLLIILLMLTITYNDIVRLLT